MSLNLRRYARLGVLGFLIVYFTAQALTGERGLLNDGERKRELAERQAELASLETQKAELQARVDGLSSRHLSLAVLEERARVVLGYVRPDDYVIRETRPS